MGDDRVKDEFERIKTVAIVEREELDIAMFQDALIDAWCKLGDARYKLGRLDERLEVKE